MQLFIRLFVPLLVTRSEAGACDGMMALSCAFAAGACENDNNLDGCKLVCLTAPEFVGDASKVSHACDVVCNSNSASVSTAEGEKACQTEALIQNQIDCANGDINDCEDACERTANNGPTGLPQTSAASMVYEQCLSKTLCELDVYGYYEYRPWWSPITFSRTVAGQQALCTGGQSRRLLADDSDTSRRLTQSSAGDCNAQADAIQLANMFVHYSCAEHWTEAANSADGYKKVMWSEDVSDEPLCGYVGMWMRINQGFEVSAANSDANYKRLFVPDLNHRRYFDVLTRHTYGYAHYLYDFASCFIEVMTANTKNSYCSYSGNNFNGHWMSGASFGDTTEGIWMLDTANGVTEDTYRQALANKICGKDQNGNDMSLVDTFTAATVQMRADHLAPQGTSAGRDALFCTTGVSQGQAPVCSGSCKFSDDTVIANNWNNNDRSVRGCT